MSGEAVGEAAAGLPAWAVISRSLRGTRNLARRLGQTLAPGTVVAFRGELGAGKTTFIQGLAEGLGVEETVVSPTFALMNVYESGRCGLIHVDFYRLEDADAVRALGIEEQLARRDVIKAVEWADNVPELFDRRVVWIEMSWEGPRARRIAVRGVAKPRGVRLAAG